MRPEAEVEVIMLSTSLAFFFRLRRVLSRAGRSWRWRFAFGVRFAHKARCARGSTAFFYTLIVWFYYSRAAYTRAKRGCMRRG